jgi:mRNA-degrading endonuclease RelE of RelBE toxin-antitoxin system
MFKIIGTDTYLKEISKWSKAERGAAEKIPQQLKENAFSGQQLRYPFLREKRIGGKRIYYLIYEDLELVLLIATSGKKDQQATIEHVIAQFKEFRKTAEQISKQVS